MNGSWVCGRVAQYPQEMLGLLGESSFCFMAFTLKLLQDSSNVDLFASFDFFFIVFIIVSKF